MDIIWQHIFGSDSSEVSLPQGNDCGCKNKTKEQIEKMIADPTITDKKRQKLVKYLEGYRKRRG